MSEIDNRPRLRNHYIDVLKGLLIILVVLGHFDKGVLHNVIFLFHMPLFFMASGFLLKRDRLEKRYIVNKVQSLMRPYLIYLAVDLFLVQRDFSIKSIIRALWGGRVFPGVYWYVTCFLFALLLLSIMIRYLPDKTVKALILTGGYSGY